MTLLPTTMETAPTGTINPTGIFNANWEIINNIFDPAHVGAQAGVLAAALAGMTTLTYGATTTVNLNTGRPLQVVTLAGNTTFAVGEKVAGRSRRVIIVGDGTDRVLTWPVGAQWAGPAVTSLPLNKTAVVDIMATSTTDASLVLTSVSRFDLATTADLAAFATLTGAETLTNKTFTSAKVNALLDTNGNAAIVFTATASAVNRVTYANAATGTAPSLTASGADTNINLILSGKGTGHVTLPRAVIDYETFRPHTSNRVEVTSSRPLTDADNGKTLWSTAAYTLTAPHTLTLPFSIVTEQRGSGAFTYAVSGGSFALRNVDGHTKSGGQWTSCTLDIMAGSNDVVLAGRTAA